MGGGRTARIPVDRASPADLMQLATDVGPAPMHVGADPSRVPDVAVLIAALRQELGSTVR